MDALGKVYENTIKDFEIELRNCKLFQFRRKRTLRRLIKEYEDRLDKHLLKTGQLDL